MTIRVCHFTKTIKFTVLKTANVFGVTILNGECQHPVAVKQPVLVCADVGVSVRMPFFTVAVT